MKRESDIEKDVCDYATKHGWCNIKIGTGGYPDRQFLQKGYVFFIEFKRGGKDARLLQKYMINQLKKLGFDAYVCDNVEKGKRLIDEKTRGLPA